MPKNSRASKISGACASVTGAWCYIIDDAAKVVSVTRIAHRREVYE
jgi:hypothetical protein